MPLIYVPILKGKEGEYGALEALDDALKDQIVPLVEVPAVPFDYVNERPVRSLDEHITGVADRLRRTWVGRPLYLELPWFGSDDTLVDGTIAASRVFRDCHGLAVTTIPVLRTSTSHAYLNAVRENQIGR